MHGDEVPASARKPSLIPEEKNDGKRPEQTARRQSRELVAAGKMDVAEPFRGAGGDRRNYLVR
jgi:hypothetical protein